MNNFETYMNKYKDSWWCLKNQDGIFNLVNHNMYLFLRKGEDNHKEKVTISPYSYNPRMDEYSSNNIKLLLTATECTNLVFKNRIKKLQEYSIDLVILYSDDGGSIIFNESDLDIICTIFKIKKKQKRELNENQRQVLRDRLLNVNTTKPR